MSIRFDSDQKHSGVNKYGHYQFGNRTCQLCKGDTAELEVVTEKGKEVKRLVCYICQPHLHPIKKNKK